MLKFNKNNVISNILAFILYLFITILVLFVIILNTFLSKGFLSNKLYNSEYIELLYTEADQLFSSYATVSGFEEEFFTSIITKSVINEDINADLDYIYNEPNPNKPSDIKALIENTLIANLTENKVEVTQKTKDSVSNLADECTKEYKEIVTLPFGEKIHSMLTIIKPIVIYSILIISALTLFLIYLLYLCQKKYRLVKYLYYSNISAGLTLLIPSLLLFLFNNISHIGITNEALYNLIVSYCKSFIDILVLCSVLLVLFGIVMLIYYLQIRKKIKVKVSNEQLES